MIKKMFIKLYHLNGHVVWRDVQTENVCFIKFTFSLPTVIFLHHISPTLILALDLEVILLE